MHGQIKARTNGLLRFLFTAASLATSFATGLSPAVAGPCDEGACGMVAPDPCWEIVSQQCLASPGMPSFATGPAQAFGVPEVLVCDSCHLAQGEGAIDMAIGQETGYSFCITFEAGVKFTAGASICGIGVGSELSASVGTKVCFDNKRWREHTVRCRCPAGTLVHCTTRTEIVPIRIRIPMSYDLATCYQRRESTGEECNPPADGMTSFTESIHCSDDVKSASDTRLHVIAAFVSGECGPVFSVDSPPEWKKGG